MTAKRIISLAAFVVGMILAIGICVLMWPLNPGSMALVGLICIVPLLAAGHLGLFLYEISVKKGKKNEKKEESCTDG